MDFEHGRRDRHYGMDVLLWILREFSKITFFLKGQKDNQVLAIIFICQKFLDILLTQVIG